MHDFPTEHVVVSLAGDRVSTRRLSFPFRDRRKIGPAVPFEVDAQVPFDLRDFFVDWEIIGEQAGRTEVTATLAPRSEVALLLDTVREAGLSPRTVEAEGLVLAKPERDLRARGDPAAGGYRASQDHPVSVRERAGRPPLGPSPSPVWRSPKPWHEREGSER